MTSPVRLGFKWTSTRERSGWRHFHVVAVRRDDEGGRSVVLAASVDATVRLVVPAPELKQRAEWLPGWQQLG